MPFAVVWKYEDSEGETKVLVGHPGAYGSTQDDALKAARLTAANLPGEKLEPLAVVQTDEDVDEDIYACEEVYLGEEPEDELFYDITAMGLWSRQAWWPQ